MTLGNKQIDCDRIDELLEAQLSAIDEATAIPRPHGIEKFYLEEVVEKRAAEQPLLLGGERRGGGTAMADEGSCPRARRSRRDLVRHCPAGRGGERSRKVRASGESARRLYTSRPR